MARNRVIYQSEALFASKEYNSTGLSDHAQLHRVQSANYGFTINRQDVNQFGNLARIDSLILEPPTVNFDLSYYVTNGYNERVLNFSVQNPFNTTEAQFASGHLGSSSGQNLFILTVDEGKDANLNRGTNATTNTVIGIGNAFITDYTLDLSVGSLPTATVSLEASNIISDATISGNGTISGFTGIASPAVKPEDGSELTDQIEIPYATGNSHTGDYSADGADKLAALRPGDITIDLSNMSGSLSKLNGPDGIHLQSASLSLPLSRTPIERLNSKFPFARVVDFPVNATLTVNAIVNTIEAENLANVIAGCGGAATNEITLTLKECGGAATGMLIKMKGATLDAESFSSSIGSNKSVDLTFSTQIGGTRDTNNGIFVSGSNDTKLPWE